MSGRIRRGKVRFNLLRVSSSAKQTLTWKDVFYAHEPDRFGVLQIYTPADEIIHGPWTFGITSTSAGINWESAGGCPGMVSYRKKGTAEFRKAYANITGDVQDRNQKLHPVILHGLEPAADYEYDVGDNIPRFFRTLDPQPADFSFVMTSDIHTRAASLREMIARPAVRQADFMVLLGDLVTGCSGRNVCYDGYLDVMSAGWNKPFYCTRGNHEYRGNAPSAFFELFPAFGKKSYFTLNHKGVLFILLDTDGDVRQSDSYYREQMQWLKQVVASKEFQDAEFRVLLAHVPFYMRGQGGGEQILGLFNSLPDPAKQAFDLMLAGHLHCYCRLMPGDAKLYSTDKALNGSTPVMKLAFPVLVNEFDGFMAVKKTSRGLMVRAYSERGAKLIDTVHVARKK